MQHFKVQFFPGGLMDLETIGGKEGATLYVCIAMTFRATKSWESIAKHVLLSDDFCSYLLIHNFFSIPWDG